MKYIGIEDVRTFKEFAKDNKLPCIKILKSKNLYDINDLDLIINNKKITWLHENNLGIFISYFCLKNI